MTLLFVMFQAVFSLQGLMMFGLYTASLGVSFATTFLFWRRQAAPPVLLDLQGYKRLRPRNVLIGLTSRAQVFLKRAGYTILSMTLLIWVLATVPRPPVARQSQASAMPR